MTNNIFDSNIDELFFEEAFFKNIVFKNNTLVIPYINLGVSNHALNLSAKLMYIDYCYFIAEKVTYLSTWIKNENNFNGQQYEILNEKKDEIIYVGGRNIESKSIYNSLEICSKRTYLKTLPESKLANSYFIPIDTPNFKKNMDTSKIDYFFTNAVKQIFSHH